MYVSVYTHDELKVLYRKQPDLAPCCALVHPVPAEAADDAIFSIFARVSCRTLFLASTSTLRVSFSSLSRRSCSSARAHVGSTARKREHLKWEPYVLVLVQCIFREGFRVLFF